MEETKEKKEVENKKESRTQRYSVTLSITQSEKNLFHFMQNHYGLKNKSEYACLGLLAFSKEQYRMLKIRKKISEEMMEEYKTTRKVYERTMANMKQKIKEVQENTDDGYNGTADVEMEQPFNMDELFN